MYLESSVTFLLIIFIYLTDIHFFCTLRFIRIKFSQNWNQQIDTSENVLTPAILASSSSPPPPLIFKAFNFPSYRIDRSETLLYSTH